MGTDERVIVTAARNVFVGAIVPVAVDGAVLANGTKIGTNDFSRGLLFLRMFCSIEELGMNTDLFSKEIMEGILILPENTPLGMDARELLWLDDVIIDVELTANRSDCQSIIGIAREASATPGSSDGWFYHLCCDRKCQSDCRLFERQNRRSCLSALCGQDAESQEN